VETPILEATDNARHQAPRTQVVPEICVDSATVLAPMRLESIPCYFVIPLSFGAAFHLYGDPGMVASRRYRSQQSCLSRMVF
jgi:hypothetical protein